MISFNDTLTNDIVSFEQLGPGCYFAHVQDGLNLCILCIFEGTDTAYLRNNLCKCKLISSKKCLYSRLITTNKCVRKWYKTDIRHAMGKTLNLSHIISGSLLHIQTMKAINMCIQTVCSDHCCPSIQSIIHNLFTTRFTRAWFFGDMMIIWCFTSLHILFNSYWDDGRVIVKTLCNKAP